VQNLQRICHIEQEHLECDRERRILPDLLNESIFFQWDLLQTIIKKSSDFPEETENGQLTSLTNFTVSVGINAMITMPIINNTKPSNNKLIEQQVSRLFIF
jgi:hypothetical protein